MKGRLFVARDAADPERATLDADGVRHLRALRLAAGDELCAIVAPGRERRATVERIARDHAILRLGSELPPNLCDPRRACTLAVALGDLARFDLIVEKATELGATAIQPFAAARSQVRTVPASRLERWRRIARAACEQCGRTVAPEIAPCVDFAALLDIADATMVVWVLSPPHDADAADRDGAAREPRSNAGELAADAGADARALLVVVGPEGGLDDDERRRLAAHGARAVTLGPRVLRFETAAIAALAVALGPPVA
jgi:16S rRNA (uracil1498-N3)-methyltransferase